MTENALLDEVTMGLAARKGQWKKIADEIEGVSYDWISQIGRGTYKSDPSYGRLQLVAAYLRANPEV